MVNNIKKLRLRAGITQKELSEKSGVPQCKLSGYEALESLEKITVGSLDKLASALGVTLNDVIYPLPEGGYEENVLDVIMEQYAADKEAAENGDVDAIINNRYM